MIDLSCVFRQSVVGRSGQRRCINAAGHCCNERLRITWKLDGGVMVLDSQRPAIGSRTGNRSRIRQPFWIAKLSMVRSSELLVEARYVFVFEARGFLILSAVLALALE